jgi:hypothetical protein
VARGSGAPANRHILIADGLDLLDARVRGQLVEAGEQLVQEERPGSTRHATHPAHYQADVRRYRITRLSRVPPSWKLW